MLLASGSNPASQSISGADNDVDNVVGTCDRFNL